MRNGRALRESKLPHRAGLAVVDPTRSLHRSAARPRSSKLRPLARDGDYPEERVASQAMLTSSFGDSDFTDAQDLLGGALE